MAASSHKQIATDFLSAVAKGDVRRAFASYVADNFRHHNGYFPGDAEPLARAMEENAAQNPDKKVDIQQVIEEGDRVIAFSRLRHKPDAPEFALVHIFRFEGDRIAELWDVAQEVPANSPNQYGMF